MYTLPTLPYAYSALEPYFDAKTMELHHTKHHQTYLDKCNDALANYPELAALPAEQLITQLESLVPSEIRQKIRNFGGGFINHNFFFASLTPNQTEVPAQLSTALIENFKSIDQFKEQFSQVAATVFGSGWAWLVQDGQDLKITTTANQDSPLTLGQKPLLALDVWEHAYYLKYQNRRPEFITAFWRVVDWQVVAGRLGKFD